MQIFYAPDVELRVRRALKGFCPLPQMKEDPTLESGIAVVINGNEKIEIQFTEGMWSHHCERGGGFIETLLDEECNWCGVKK